MMNYNVDLTGMSEEMISKGGKFIGELLKVKDYPLTLEGADLLRLHAREAIDEITKEMINLVNMDDAD